MRGRGVFEDAALSSLQATVSMMKSQHDQALNATLDRVVKQFEIHLTESQPFLHFVSIPRFDSWVTRLGIACHRSDARPSESWATVGRVLGEMREKPTC